MTLHLYQIGRVSAHIHRDSLWTPYDNDAGSKTQSYLWSHRRSWPDTQYQPQPQTITEQGYLISSNQGNRSQLLQAYRQHVGIPTDIIAYDIDVGKCACACEGELTWLHTRGVLQSVSPANANPHDLATIALKVDIEAYWEPLDPSFWKWETYFPTAAQLFAFHNCNRMFVKQKLSNVLSVYDPAGWECTNISHAISWMPINTWHEIQIDPLCWPAPPRSMYALKNLPTFGEVTINVNREVGVWGDHNQEATVIDLAATHNKLVAAGRTGLLRTDIMIVGDVFGRPGFILRNGSIIEDVFVTAFYPAGWPGQISSGNSRIMINGHSQIVAGFQHIYRRL